jgi:hypothetical protein
MQRLQLNAQRSILLDPFGKKTKGHDDKLHGVNQFPMSRFVARIVMHHRLCVDLLQSDGLVLRHWSIPAPCATMLTYTNRFSRRCLMHGRVLQRWGMSFLALHHRLHVLFVY